MPNRVPQRIHQQLGGGTGRIGKRLAARYLENLQGKRLQVLVEGVSPDLPGILVGTADRFVPVELPGHVDIIGPVP